MDWTCVEISILGVFQVLMLTSVYLKPTYRLPRNPCPIIFESSFDDDDNKRRAGEIEFPFTSNNEDK